MNRPITRRGFLGNLMLAATVAGSPPPAWAKENKTARAVRQPARSSITVGVVQQAREPQLGANRDKIVRFTAQAGARGCRLVIFPEDALGCPVGTSNENIEKAVDAIRAAARSNDVYVIFCAPFAIPGFAPERRGHCLRAIGPDGRGLLRFNKLICNLPPSDPRRAPGVFLVDGIACCAMICADRWLRGFEELPVTLGAKILIDCSSARPAATTPMSWFSRNWPSLARSPMTSFARMRPSCARR